MFRTTPLIAALALSFAASDSYAAVASPATIPGEKDIIDTAVSAGSFTTLAAALEAAGLVDALKGDGPFTVFAPTDAAFAKLPKGTVETLLRPENRASLTGILTFHVVPGRLPAANVVTLTSTDTLNGQRASISTQDGVMIAEAGVVKTDIECSNGIIHVIDSVMLPSDDTIVDIAINNGSFGTLVAAVKAAGLVDTLSSDGPFTVFAPTDAAFAKLPKEILGALLKKENKQTLTDILTYHVVSGRVFGDQAIGARSAATVQGQKVDFTIRDGGLFANDSAVVANDIQARNGVIHVIDSVLLPPGLELPAPSGRLVIGIYNEQPGAALASQLGIDAHASLLLTRIVKGSMAEACGLREFDVITHIDGMPATDEALKKAKTNAGFGGEIAMTVIREGRTQKIACGVGIEDS